MLSKIIMCLAILFALFGEYKYGFYFEDIIIMAMLVAVYFKKGDV